MKLNNETKPDSLKGIKNVNRNKGHTRKIRDNSRIPTCQCSGIHQYEVVKIYLHSDHPVDSEFSMNDGTMYRVRADGAWIFLLRPYIVKI